MRWLDQMKLQIRSRLRARQAEAELEAEMQDHLAQEIDANVRAGMAPGEAKEKALQSFGNVTLQKEACRDARGFALLDSVMQDFRYALRGLRLEPGLALTAALTLAICIGANTTVFSLVNSTLIRSLPYPHAERLFWLTERMGWQQQTGGIGADYYSLREENRVFDDVAAYDTTTVNWNGIEEPEQLRVARTTPSFFHVLDVQPMRGRYLAEEEQGVKSPPVVVLSYGFWRDRLASNPAIVGKTILLDGLSRTVIGVMPQGFDYPKGTRLWEPLDMDDASQRPRSPNRPMRNVSIFARAKAGVPEARLSSEMKRLTANIRMEYPKSFRDAGFLKGMDISAISLQRRMTGDLRPALLVLTGAVALVLLIACANLANLLLARATAKRRELAVRMALGSGQNRITRHVLIESIVFALPGGIAGALLAVLTVRALNVFKPLALENYPPIAFDTRTMAFTFGLALLAGLLFGLAPALAAAGINVQDALKSAGPTQSGNRRAVRMRRSLVVLELAMSLVLLIGAALLTRSFVKLAHVDLGFRSENLLTLRFNLTGQRYAKGPAQTDYYQNVLERIDRLPNVRSAAVATDMPLSGEQPYSQMFFQVEGRPPTPPSQTPAANSSSVSRGFFHTLGIPLRRGRLFDSEDTLRTGTKILVNEALVRLAFPREDPIGRRIRPGFSIIGVVGNIRGSHLGAEPAPMIYFCSCQNNSPFQTQMALFVRTLGDPHKAVRDVEAQAYSVDRNEPVFDVATMDERLAHSLAPQGFHLLLVGTFAAIALVLSAIGIYGVMTYLVARRRREIGIRLAVGAQPAQIVGMVTNESFLLILVALVAGLAGAWGVTRYLKSMLYGVTPFDAVSFTATPLLLALIALTASFFPAQKAAQTDPTVILREE